MSDLKEITARFNVYDFLNPIISGTYFIFGTLIILYPVNLFSINDIILSILFKGGKNQGIIYAIFVVLFYLMIAYILGLILQFLGQSFFNFKENQMIEGSLKCLERHSFRIQYPFNSYFKLRAFRADARYIFEMKNLGRFDHNNPEHNNYVYAFCVYHNQIYGFNQKTETLREVWGLSKELTTASFILFIIALCVALASFLIQLDNYLADLLIGVFFIAITFVFYYRTQLALRNRIRMNYSLYHVSKDIYSMSLKIDNLHKLSTQK
ncbi:MAG: hypothetical protein HDR44_05230 [Allobaculum sp.]|nr:hypothetical protein [Allobaculum sp.]